MLTIKLSRFGKKKQPSYRLLVMEKTKDPWGDYLEALGSYNPRSKQLNLKEDRVKHWLSIGAQPSDTVHNLLVNVGLIKADKKSVTTISGKRKKKLDEKIKASKEKEDAAKEKEAEAKPVEQPAEVPAEKPTAEQPVEQPVEKQN